jgi:alkylhydroperoxidase family enzyme
MAWIRTIGPGDPDATPELLAAYRAAGRLRPAEYGGTGGPSNIIKSHSVDPEALRTAFEAGMHLINGPGPLSRPEREMIATVTSAANKCFY